MASPNQCYGSTSVFRPCFVLPPLHSNFLRYCSPSTHSHRKEQSLSGPENVFQALKRHLVEAPVLSYPCFDSQASTFVLQTDTSATGLGAVLEQDGHVIAYVSCSLTAPQRQYSVIQQECLAVVYALKHLWHYLLGRKFHRPCPPSVAIGSKDGRHSVQVGACSARV